MTVGSAMSPATTLGFQQVLLQRDHAVLRAVVGEATPTCTARVTAVSSTPWPTKRRAGVQPVMPTP